MLIQIGKECDLGYDQVSPLHAPHGLQTSTYLRHSNECQYQEFCPCQLPHQSPKRQQKKSMHEGVRKRILMAMFQQILSLA